jgi:hypothetical protein
MRNWSKLKEWFDPGRTLRELRAVELQIAGQPIDPRVRALRTRGLQKYNEWRQAALFCQGISSLIGTTLYFAPVEAEAHDYVTKRVDHGAKTTTFTPLQLKELVPSETNPDATLEGILADLTKYSTASDTIVAVYINRRGTTDLNTIKVPRLNLGELWLFWAASEDQSSWQLYGDLLKGAALHDFSYPA